MFNNRELATGIWLAVLAAFAVSRPEVRQSLLSVWRAFLQRTLLLCLGCMTLYVGVVVVLLWSIGFWNGGLTKDTVLWFAFSGFVMVAAFATSDDNENLFGKILRDNVKAVILIEFLINSYTFSFAGELLFVPLVSIIVAVDAFARTSPEHAPAARFTGGLLAVIGLSLFGFAIFSAIADYPNLGTLDRIRSILLAPVLALVLSPFVYVVALISTYQTAFLRLTIGREKSNEVTKQARRRILSRFRLRLRPLRTFVRDHGLDLMRVQTIGDVNDLLGLESDSRQASAQ